MGVVHYLLDEKHETMCELGKGPWGMLYRLIGDGGRDVTKLFDSWREEGQIQDRDHEYWQLVLTWVQGFCEHAEWRVCVVNDCSPEGEPDWPITWSRYWD